MRKRHERTPGRDRGRTRGKDIERSERPERGGRTAGARRGTARRKFTYHKRTAEDVNRRQQAGQGSGVSYINGDFKRYSVSDGDNVIRILPPTWEDAEHFGLDLYVHYGIGPDNSAFLCPKRMRNEECPICEASQEADADGDEDLARRLAPSHRVLYWLIDRDKEKEGPMLWAAPYRSIDKELAARMVDKRTGEVLNIDDPDEGYDVSYTKTGKAERTRYEGVQIDRHSSDLGRNADEWLEYITEHPLPDLLNFVDTDQIEEVFSAGSSKRDHKEDDRDEDTRGRSRSRRHEPEPEEDEDSIPGYEDVMSMDFDELCDTIEEFGIAIDPDDYPEGEEQELAEDIAAELGVEAEPAPARSRRRR